MKWKLPPILLFAIASFLFGCSSPPEDGKQTAPTAASAERSTEIKGLEERFGEKWEKRTRDPIPPPAWTPYDDDPEIKAAYLQAFRNGVEHGLREGRNFGILCFVHPKSRLMEVRIEGFKAGRTLVIRMLPQIYEDIGQDLSHELEGTR